MRVFKKFNRYVLLSVIIVFTFSSCAVDRPALFSSPVGSNLFAKSREASEGELSFYRPKKLEYRFDESFSVPPNSSIEIEYDFNILPSKEILERYSLVLNMGAVSWELPMDIHGILYSVPVDDSFDGHFSVSLEPSGKPSSAGKIKKEEYPVLKIRSLWFIQRQFGFNRNTDQYFFSSPFETYSN